MNSDLSARDDANEVDPYELEDAVNSGERGEDAARADERVENLAAWDEPPSVAGTRAPRVMPEDEISVPKMLVEEGVEQADRDRRIAASDPDFEG